MSTLPTPDPRPPPRRSSAGQDPACPPVECPDDSRTRSKPDRIVRIAKLIAAVGVALGGLAKLIDALL
jgi:hypothetical protein